MSTTSDQEAKGKNPLPVEEGACRQAKAKESHHKNATDEAAAAAPDNTKQKVAAPPVAKGKKTVTKATTTTKRKPKKKEKKTKQKDPSDPKNWPKVGGGDYDYVYIHGGPHDGRYGYYDDDDPGPLIYFGAPLVGDGPYEIPRRYLRIPPQSHRGDQSFSPF